MNLSRSGYLLAALALHAAALWGVTFGPPAFIADEGEQGDAIDVSLVEIAGQPAESPADLPQPEPERPPPVPPEPERVQEPPPPPPDAITESEPVPQPPKPARQPAAKPKSSSVARQAPSSRASANAAASAGSPGAGSQNPRPGDSSHASWRNRVKPIYPAAARAARQAGRVLVIVSVNALGRPTGASVYGSSGFPALDQAALAAARASTYNPRKIAGIPLPDSITAPYSFRLEDR